MAIGNNRRTYRLNVLIKKLIADIKKDGFVGDLVRVSNEHSAWVSRFKDSPITIQDHLIWNIFKYEGKALSNYCANQEEVAIEYIGKIKIKDFQALNIKETTAIITERGYTNIKDVPKSELIEISKIVSEKLYPIFCQSKITKKQLNPYNSHLVIDSVNCPDLASKLFKSTIKNK